MAFLFNGDLNTVTPFDLPAWAQITGVVTGAMAVVFAVVSLVLQVRWAPRAGNEKQSLDGKRLPIINRWRPLLYSLAVGNMQLFIDRIASGGYVNGDRRGYVTREDLDRWTLQAALTCAAFIVPNSLGKSNFFRVSSLTRNGNGETTGVRVYSSEFVGVFSPDQLCNPLPSTQLRYLGYTEGQPASEIPAAVACVRAERPILQTLAARHSGMDEPERQFGSTHILAIPLARSFDSLEYEDQPVSITVDLRYGHIKSFLLRHRTFEKSTLFRRARDLTDALAQVEFGQIRYSIVYDYLTEEEAGSRKE